MLTSRSGRRSRGDWLGSAPPRVMWLPPPVPLCRPSIAKVSVPSRQVRAMAYSVWVSSASSVQLEVGCRFTSITPGSGVTSRFLIRGSGGGP